MGCSRSRGFFVQLQLSVCGVWLGAGHVVYLAQETSAILLGWCTAFLAHEREVRERETLPHSASVSVRTHINACFQFMAATNVAGLHASLFDADATQVGSLHGTLQLTNHAASPAGVSPMSAGGGPGVSLAARAAVGGDVERAALLGGSRPRDAAPAAAGVHRGALRVARSASGNSAGGWPHSTPRCFCR
jgi:hypothetical protein